MGPGELDTHFKFPPGVCMEDVIARVERCLALQRGPPWWLPRRSTYQLRLAKATFQKLAVILKGR